MQPADTLIRWAVALLTMTNLPLNCALVVFAAWCFVMYDVYGVPKLARSIELPGARTGFERTRRSFPEWFKFWAVAMVLINWFARGELAHYMGALALWFRMAVVSRMWLGPMSICVQWTRVRDKISPVEMRNLLLEATIIPLIVAPCVVYFRPDALQDAGDYGGVLLAAYASQSLVWAYCLVYWWPELLYPLQESDPWVAEKPFTDNPAPSEDGFPVPLSV